MKKQILPLLLLFALVATSCEDTNYSSSKLHVHVTRNGEIPDAYFLKIYRGDKLVKTDEFDRQYRLTSNFTEVVDPLPGPYYFEVKSGDIRVEDSVALWGMDLNIVKIIKIDLNQ